MTHKFVATAALTYASDGASAQASATTVTIRRIRQELACPVRVYPLEDGELGVVASLSDFSLENATARWAAALSGLLYVTTDISVVTEERYVGPDWQWRTTQFRHNLPDFLTRPPGEGTESAL